MRKLVVLLCLAAWIGSGCALVSGLSSLDVGSGTTGDASVDAKGSPDASSLDGGSDAFDARDGDTGAPVDAAKDADATACAVPGVDPPVVASACSTGNPALQAGAIPAATYALTGYREFAGDCNGYVSKSATGVLVVAVQGNTYFLQERLTISGVVTSRYYTATVSGTTMTATLTCGPAISANQWPLFVATQGAKTQLVVLKPSQPADQRFFWTQE